MERETRTITTPKGHEAVLKTYLTARERNVLRNVYLEEVKIDTKNGESGINDLGGSIIEKAEHKLIEVAVISYKGKTGDVLNDLLDETPEEYDFVINEAGNLNNSFTGAK